MPPKVSIVIPAFNNEEYIRETMHSVLGQTYPHLEVIVADHSSRDGTLAILREFEADPRVRIISTPAGGGAVRNWNRVTRQAEGEYLKLVCGDDLLEPGCVATQVAAFETGVDLVASRRNVVDADGKAIFRARGLKKLLGRRAGLDAIRTTVRAGTNLFGEPATVMFRRAALERAGLWDDQEHYLIDEATYVAVLLDGDFVGCAEPQAAFRLSGSQWSFRLARSQAAEAVAYHRRLAREHPALLSRTDLVLGNLRARAAARGRRLIYVLLGSRLSKAS